MTNHLSNFADDLEAGVRNINRAVNILSRIANARQDLAMHDHNWNDEYYEDFQISYEDHKPEPSFMLRILGSKEIELSIHNTQQNKEYEKKFDFNDTEKIVSFINEHFPVRETA